MHGKILSPNRTIKCKVGTLKRPIYITRIQAPKKSPTVPPRASLDWQTLSYESYLIGKSIIIFTMVYCSLNWMHYRKMRKDLEDTEDETEK